MTGGTETGPQKGATSWVETRLGAGAGAGEGAEAGEGACAGSGAG